MIARIWTLHSVFHGGLRSCIKYGQNLGLIKQKKRDVESTKPRKGVLW